MTQITQQNNNSNFPTYKSISKRRNFWFILANEKTQELILNYKDIELLLNDIYKYSINYINEIENKVIVLSKENKFLLIPYTTRFNEAYIERKRKLFKKLSYRLKNVIGRHTFLTITYDPKNITSLMDMRYSFTRNLTKFLDLLKKKYNYLAIIKTYEFTKSGLIHAHILILNVPHINKEWLTKTLKLCGLGKIKKIKEFKGLSENSLNYFFKYFSKSFKSLNYKEEGNPNLALSWALNLRTYTFSAKLYDYLKPKKILIKIECKNCDYNREEKVELKNLTLINQKILTEKCPKCHNQTLKISIIEKKPSSSTSSDCLLEYSKTSTERKGFTYEGIYEYKGVYGFILATEFYQLYGAG